jgi:archaellum biogenesis ATPase FlaH
MKILNKELHREYATKMSNEIGQSNDDLKSIIRNITNIMEVNIYNSTELSEATRNSLQNILTTIKVKTMPLPIIDPFTM